MPRRARRFLRAQGIIARITTGSLVLFALILPAAGCGQAVTGEVTSTGLSATIPAIARSAPTSASTTAPDPTTTTAPAPVADTVIVTDVYDNRVVQAGLQGDWGFACLIQGFGQTILFDTGADGQILLANLRALGLDKTQIDIVVLSHEHSDHIGGLLEIVRLNPAVVVYCPASFSVQLTNTVQAAGAEVISVDAPLSPCPGATITTPLAADSIEELGLLLDTSVGPVFVTGCAHPGITRMSQAATDLAGRPLFAVLGGFHLLNASASSVRSVIGELQALGVQACGPSHCTGDQAIALFQEAYGAGFIAMGVGAVVEF